MPHVIVKLYPGRSEQQKARLAEEIVKDVVAIAKCGEEAVSVAIEEINPEDWAEWRTQSGALHPGYPECPCPLHLAPDGPPLRESMHGIRTPPGPVAFRALVVGMRQLERPDTLGSRLALRWRDFAIRRRALHPIR